MKRRSIGGILALIFSVFVVTSLATQGSAIAQSKPSTVVTTDFSLSETGDSQVVRFLKYKVRKGDNLTHIAGRFGVTLSDIRSEAINPQLAKRKNHDLLYSGELLTIPVYGVIKDALVAKATSNETIVMRKETYTRLVDSNVELQKTYNHEKQLLEQKFNNTQRWSIVVLGMAVAFACAFVLLAGSLVSGLIRRKENLLTETKLPMLGNFSATEILTSLRSARGLSLEALVSLGLTKDEIGNPVTLKKVREFLEKRPALRDLPVNQWEEAMKKPKPATQTTTATVTDT